MNFKNLAMWGIIVFLTIGLYNMFKNPQTTTNDKFSTHSGILCMTYFR